jgi:putative spermidine/putrescine transport system substrate-binding protein
VWQRLRHPGRRRAAAQQQDLLDRGEAPVAVLFDGRIWTMEDAGVPIRYQIPSEGIYGNMDYFGVPKGAPNKELAFEFIDFALAPESQKRSGVGLHYGPTNDQVTFSGAEAERVIWTPEQLQEVHFEDAQYAAEHSDEWTEKWNKWQSSL